MNITSHHYILLLFRITLFIITFINANYISHTLKKTSWVSFLPTIIIFTLYSGLRWGRGTDYNIYYWVYNDINKGISREDNEALFELLVKFFGFLGLEWQHFVAFMSFFLIFAGCYFLKKNDKALSFSLPFFVLGVGLAENLMRWYLGFSFILIGLYYLLENKQKWFFIFSTLGFFVHYGLIIVIIVFYLVWVIFKKPIFTPLIAFSLYLALFFLFDPQFMGNFTDIIQQIDLGTRFLSYQNNAEAWLTGEANDDVRTQLSISNIITTAFLIYAGYIYYKKNKTHDIACMYNWALLGWILRPAATQIEIAMRIHAPFFLMGHIYTAYLCYDILIKRKNQYNSLLRNITTLFFIYTLYSYIFKYVFNLEEFNTYFIWDSAGRHILP